MARQYHLYIKDKIKFPVYLLMTFQIIFNTKLAQCFSFSSHGRLNARQAGNLYMTSRDNIYRNNLKNVYIKSEVNEIPPNHHHITQRNNHLTETNVINEKKKKHEMLKRDWTLRSLNYYSKVMRDNTGRERAAIELLLEKTNNNNNNNSNDSSSLPYTDANEEELRTYAGLAKRHYFARHKIKNLQPRHAERIYRKIIDEIIENRDSEDEHCDHAALAVSTLLLSLLLQRLSDIKGARAVFMNFFRVVFVDGEPPSDCKCSAKVLQAYALFEMKRGNHLKGHDLINKAISLDGSLAPVLKWKQFRDVDKRWL